MLTALSSEIQGVTVNPPFKGNVGRCHMFTPVTLPTRKHREKNGNVKTSPMLWRPRGPAGRRRRKVTIPADSRESADDFWKVLPNSQRLQKSVQKESSETLPVRASVSTQTAMWPRPHGSPTFLRSLTYGRKRKQKWSQG